MGYNLLDRGIRYFRDGTILLAATAVLSGCLSQTASYRGTRYTILPEGNSDVVPISFLSSKEQINVSASNMYNLGAAQKSESNLLFDIARENKNLETITSTTIGSLGLVADSLLVIKLLNSDSFFGSGNSLDSVDGCSGAIDKGISRLICK